MNIFSNFYFKTVASPSIIGMFGGETGRLTHIHSMHTSKEDPSTGGNNISPLHCESSFAQSVRLGLYYYNALLNMKVSVMVSCKSSNNIALLLHVEIQKCSTSASGACNV